MTPIPQSPTLKFYKSLEREKLNALIDEAMHWRRTNGWPGRDQDVVLAAQLYLEYRGPIEPDDVFAEWHGKLAAALFDRLSKRYTPDEEVEYRTLLCLLLIQGINRGVQFNA